MNNEITIKHQELQNIDAKFQQISNDLDNAKAQKKQMGFNPAEAGGFTAGQAIYGFSSAYEELIQVISSLTSSTEVFLLNIGNAFKEADETASAELKK